VVCKFIISKNFWGLSQTIYERERTAYDAKSILNRIREFGNAYDNVDIQSYLCFNERSHSRGANFCAPNMVQLWH